MSSCGTPSFKAHRTTDDRLIKATASSEQHMSYSSTDVPYKASSSYDAPSIFHLYIHLAPEYQAGGPSFNSLLHPGAESLSPLIAARARTYIVVAACEDEALRDREAWWYPCRKREGRGVWVATRLALPKRKGTTRAQATMLCYRAVRDSLASHIACSGGTTSSSACFLPRSFLTSLSRT